VQGRFFDSCIKGPLLRPHYHGTGTGTGTGTHTNENEGVLLIFPLDGLLTIEINNKSPQAHNGKATVQCDHESELRRRQVLFPTARRSTQSRSLAKTLRMKPEGAP